LPELPPAVCVIAELLFVNCVSLLFVTAQFPVLDPEATSSEVISNPNLVIPGSLISAVIV
jgi:hypothetical protein